MIEDNCVVHSGTGVDIGENNTIGHGVIVHCTKIGSNCLIGNNGTLLDFAKIGDFCVIGAGCLVTSSITVPDFSMMLGVPGEIKGKISAALKRRLLGGNRTYAKLIKRYKKTTRIRGQENRVEARHVMPLHLIRGIHAHQR